MFPRRHNSPQAHRIMRCSLSLPVLPKLCVTSREQERCACCYHRYDQRPLVTLRERLYAAADPPMTMPERGSSAAPANKRNTRHVDKTCVNCMCC